MMNPSCLFCRIAAGQEPATFVYQDDAVVAFRDINPKAPVHVLIVPKKHIASPAAVEAGDAAALGAAFVAARRIAEDLGVAESGFRLIANAGPDGGQLIDHLHLHLLGGRHLGPKLVA